MKILTICILFAFSLVALAQSSFVAMGGFNFTSSGQSLVFTSEDTVYIHHFFTKTTTALGKANFYCLAQQKNAVLMVIGQAVEIVDLASKVVKQKFELPEMVLSEFYVNTTATQIVFRGEESKNLYLMKITTEGITSQIIFQNQSEGTVWVSPTGKWLAINQGQKVSIYETSSQKLISSSISTAQQIGDSGDGGFPSNDFGVRQLQFAPDEKSLVVLWMGSIPKYWDAYLERWTIDGRKMGTYENSMIWELTGFSANGKQLMGFGPQLLRVWNTDTYKIRHAYWWKNDSPDRIAFSPTGTKIALRSSSCEVKDNQFCFTILSVPRFRVISRF